MMVCGLRRRSKIRVSIDGLYERIRLNFCSIDQERSLGLGWNPSSCVGNISGTASASCDIARVRPPPANDSSLILIDEHDL